MYVFDLFCASGGASVGLTHAGYKVVGVDLRPQTQTNYPTGYFNMFGQICDFVRDDPIAVLRELLDGKAVADIKLSEIAFFWINLPAFLRGVSQDEYSLLDLLRWRLTDTGKPYVIAHRDPNMFYIGRHSFKIRGPEIGQIPKEKKEGLCSFKRRSFRPGLVYTKLFESNRSIRIPARIGYLPGIYANTAKNGKKNGRGKAGWDYLNLDRPEKNTAQLKKQSVLKQTLGISWTRGNKSEQNRKIMNSCPPAYSAYIGTEMRRFLDLEQNRKQKPLDYLSLPEMEEPGKR